MEVTEKVAKNKCSVVLMFCCSECNAALERLLHVFRNTRMMESVKSECADNDFIERKRWKRD